MGEGGSRSRVVVPIPSSEPVLVEPSLLDCPVGPRAVAMFNSAGFPVFLFFD